MRQNNGNKLQNMSLVLLVATAILWFFEAFILVIPYDPSYAYNANQFTAISICITGIILSAILIAFKANSINRNRFLKNWVLIGLIISFMPLLFLLSNSTYLAYAISGLIGVFFGTGAPVFLGYFASITKETNRSTISGATFFVIGVFYSIFCSIYQITNSIIIGSSVLCILMLVAFFSLRRIEFSEVSISYRDQSWKKLSSDRTFLFYLISMSMFLSAILIVSPLVDSTFVTSFQQATNVFSYIVLGVSALISGFLGDKFGRKKLAMIGLLLAAISINILSIFPSNYMAYSAYDILDGLSRGILYPLFLFTIWGDLSKKGGSEKYYTVGCLPFMISIALVYSFGTIMIGNFPLSSALSFVSLFLFASILPIAYATEILPNLNKIQELNEKLLVVGGLTRHDIRNKLTIVNAQTYMLKKKHPQQVDIVDHANQIEQAVNDSIRLFELVKTYEELDAENLTHIDVGKTIDDAISLFSDLKIKIINDCHGASLLADSLLRQMFYNFIDNTLKHGGKASVARIYFEPDNAERVRLVYEDNGIGISYENKLKIFKQGFSTGNSTGLGLFLIKKIVDAYGWTITEEGQIGTGVKFVISIPKGTNISCISIQR